MGKFNHSVVISSLIALFFIFLTFKVDWLFIIPAVIIVFFNKKNLEKKNKDF